MRAKSNATYAQWLIETDGKKRVAEGRTNLDKYGFSDGNIAKTKALATSQRAIHVAKRNGGTNRGGLT